MTDEKASDHIYYFDKPTIAFCPDCDEFAIWMQGKGLFCPKCKKTRLSIFEWDGESRHPEGDDEEETEEESEEDEEEDNT